jgi:hypothetical protein
LLTLITLSTKVVEQNNDEQDGLKDISAKNEKGKKIDSARTG